MELNCLWRDVSTYKWLTLKLFASKLLARIGSSQVLIRSNKEFLHWKLCEKCVTHMKMCNFSIFQKINKNYFTSCFFRAKHSFLFPYRTFFNVHISCFQHFVFPRSLLSITKQGSRNSVATFDEYLNLLLEEWWIKYRVKRQSEG